MHLIEFEMCVVAGNGSRVVVTHQIFFFDCLEIFSRGIETLYMAYTKRLNLNCLDINVLRSSCFRGNCSCSLNGYLSGKSKCTSDRLYQRTLFSIFQRF